MTRLLVLPADVLVTHRLELSEDVTRRLPASAGDYVVARRLSRASSISVDADAAALLDEFRAPASVEDAVSRCARSRGLAPADVLKDAYPFLERLWSARFLVRAGAASGSRALERGDLVGDYCVVRSVRLLEDSEVVQVTTSSGDLGALKLARRGMDSIFEREVDIYERLPQGIAPRLLGRGLHDGRPYLVTSWIEGAAVVEIADDLRRIGDAEGLARLVRGVVAVYARLHEAGVLHGDVHPGNMLAADSGDIALIDFGYAAAEGAPPPPRAGVGHYFEPEYAERRADLGARGEQYSVAVLVYRLATGAHYIDLSLERRAMLRQITEAAPLPFSTHGVTAAEVEAAVVKALSKRPEERHATMRAFGDALGACEIRIRRASRPIARRDFFDRALPGGDLYETGFGEPPRASVNFGAAGVALALYRVACLRSDSRCLAAADVWMARARRDAQAGDYSEEEGLTPEVVGAISTHHTSLGVHWVGAHVNRALGDDDAARADVLAFVTRAGDGPGGVDLVMGRAGVLLAAATMGDIESVRPMGRRMLDSLGRDIDSLLLNGMAHGSCGVVYAALAFCRAAGNTPPDWVVERFEELMSRAEPYGRGLAVVPDLARRGEPMPGWCGGSAGFVHLALLAFDVLGEARMLALAERFARHASGHPDGRGDLCCGLAGRAYALLRLYRASGDPIWLARAKDLAERAERAIAARCLRRDSLYRGAVGVALLSAELATPRLATMPFFDD